MKILVSNEDDILYEDLIDFLYDIKIAQGGNSLSATLIKHPIVRKYLRKKQRERIEYIEKTFFNPDGSVKLDSLQEFRRSLQNS